ncbi:MAG: hypothetical protein AB7R89_11565 [Dehalococcoidia bacterium]
MTTIDEIKALARHFLTALDTYWRVLGEPDNAPGAEEAATRALDQARCRLEAAIK